MPVRNQQKASQSRVFTIEDRAGPSRTPQYQALARAGGLTWAQGDITPVRVPDPKQYGRFIVIDKIQGQQDLPSIPLEFRMTRDISEILKLVRKGCPVDVQLHIGACKDPSDFNAGWEKAMVFEDANITTYSTDDLGAFDADQEAPVMETIEITASDYYEVKPLAFTQVAESEIVQEVIDVVICDARTCGACGIPSDGCNRVFAVQVPAGASPGLPSEVVFTQNGGLTWDESIIDSLAVNQAPSAASCVGPYLVVVSHGDDSAHYALIADILTGDESWTEVTTGIEAAGSPVQIASVSRTVTWLIGDGGYIYFSEDITSGFTVQSAGDATTENLLSIHVYDENTALVGGENNAILVTFNQGASWSLITGPSGQAADSVTAVHMLSENEWLVGYDDGEVWYTSNGGTTWTQKTLPSQSSLTRIDAIEFSTRTVGYIAARAGSAAGAARLLRTISGGGSWYVLPEEPGLSVPSATYWNGIAACGDDPNVVFAGGLEVSAGDGILVKGA